MCQPAAKPAPVAADDDHEEDEHSDGVKTYFYMSFSSKPAEVLLEVGDESLSHKPESSDWDGSFMIDSHHPAIAVTVRWPDKQEANNFAKLVLEPEGLPTASHTFDAWGDIEDAWEPHIHP